MKFLIVCVFSLFAIMLTSCEKARDSPRGFSLPEGDLDQGKVAFVKHKCSSCHQITGIEQPESPEFSIKLGGESTQVKTYADLLTSIINPSHKIARVYPYVEVHTEGKSKMKNYNDVLTVTELVDLVTFIQPNYELLPYQRTDYSYYGYQ
ncbi:MAG: cytochrome C [Thalassotalea sp.]|nr:cytochrome C [Thalassotalea sp.]MDG2393618.1 cytochrome C [Thalassotalea sp.]